MKATAREWIEKAEADFVSAGREYRARNRPNFDAACFFAQQCIDKYLKGRLAEAGRFRRPTPLGAAGFRCLDRAFVGSGPFSSRDADELCRSLSLPRRVCDPSAGEDRHRRREMGERHDAVGNVTPRPLKPLFSLRTTAIFQLK